MTSLETWKTFEPESYYKSFLEKNKRPDGRGLMKVRPITIKIGTVTTAEGSSTVRVGHTTVMCGIKAEIATPALRNPDEGFIVPNVELYPCSSPKIKMGPPGEKAMGTSQFLKNVLHSSGVLDLKDLCIVPNKLAWCLYCDVACINYDGNLYDAALTAIMAALQNVRLPVVSYDAENDKTSVASERTLPLMIKLMDPTAEDESQGSGEVVVVLLENGSLCTTHKPGGQLILPNILDDFVKLAKKRVKVVNNLIDRVLTERMDTS
ncbi:Exosome complex component RRP43-like [Homarus americanus]|uniref:Ribosomal RNA-processing protein 43 n=1 Tax=Homarus americanus TaxID=6706 RepID=A0A8J5N251_HOMAM|nr:Exosome complex component RRP43-like [Homarus americanus]